MNLTDRRLEETVAESEVMARGTVIASTFLGIPGSWYGEVYWHPGQKIYFVIYGFTPVPSGAAGKYIFLHDGGDRGMSGGQIIPADGVFFRSGHLAATLKNSERRKCEGLKELVVMLAKELE